MCFVYTFFRVPEPRGRTFAELDVLFEHRVGARQFAKTKVDVFDEEVDGQGVINDYKDQAATTTEKA